MKKHTNQYDSQGQRHGLWEEYYSNGTPWWRSHYHHGKEHGLWEEYHPNGTLWWRVHYRHGKLHGLWEDYLEDGIPYDKRYHLLIR